MKFGNELDCLVTAVAYLKRGYTVGLNETAVDGLKETEIPGARQQ